MFSRLWVILVLLFALIATPCFSQDLTNDLGKIQGQINDNIGINGGYYVPDANGMINPATIPDMGEIGFQTCSSASVGKTNLPTGVVDFWTGGAMAKIGKNLFASGYIYSSTGQVILDNRIPLAGYGLDTRLDATEVCLGYKVSKKLSVGAAWQTENGSTNLSAGGANLANIRSESSMDYRIGAQYKLSDQWKVGTLFTNRTDKIHITAFPALTGAPDNIDLSGKYRSRSWIHGITFNPVRGTSLFYNQQFSEFRSPDGSTTNVNYPYWGIQQYITPEWNVKFEEWDSYPGLSVNYLNQQGWFGSIYYRKNKDLPGFGKSDTIFLTAGKYF